MEIEGGESDVALGYFSLENKKLQGPADKNILRDFIWAYRCVKAMADVRIREPFLEHAFKRLSFIREKTKTLGVHSIRLADLYRTELALALLVDTHINNPTLFNRIWLKAAQNALGLQANQVPNASTISQQQEMEMCAIIIQLREEGVSGSTMSDPKIRSGHIVSAIENLTDDMCSNFGFTSKHALKTLLYIKEFPNFLKTAR